MRHSVEFSCERLKDIPCLFCPKKPESCSYLWVKLDTSMLVNIKNDFEFCMKLVSEESVLLIPGVALGADNWVIRGNRVGEILFTEQAYSDMAESFNAKFRLQADMFILLNRYISTDDEKN
ncbi:hypothetical protein DY000_02057065 [Brassica cretica]|uniref:Uncharacterized protein n=1 Tax=Brassica cretica TaxID=69181 RepID=A0ABQ7AMJ7_BRACR|nr:hypothetical protein DY000_02057065 [Brassica cretica]